MESNATDDQPERGVATWKVEVFVSLALLLFGAVIAFKSWELGAGWRDDGPGAGYFPSTSACWCAWPVRWSPSAR